MRAWISPLRFPAANVSRNTVFQVRCFNDAAPKGSYGALSNEVITSARFHCGSGLRACGRERKKDAIRSDMIGPCGRSFPVAWRMVVPIADLYPCIVAVASFFSSNR